MPQFTDADKIFRMMRINTVLIRMKYGGRTKRKGGSIVQLSGWLRDVRRQGRQRGKLGRPRSTRIEENVETVEDLIMLQEIESHSHLSPRQIEKSEGIGQSSVVRIVRDKSIANFKRSKTTMKKGTRK